MGEAGFERRLRLTVDDRYLMAGTGQIIGRGDADDAAAENNDLHDEPGSCCSTAGICRRLLSSKDQATRLMASPRIETISSIWLRSTIKGGDTATASPLWRK